MLELCVLIITFAALYYHSDSFIPIVAAVPLSEPGDHIEAATDKSAAPTHLPPPEIILHHKSSSSTYHYNASQESTVCPVCYPSPPRVFAPIDPNPKYVPLVHSRNCPMQPRWVYSRRSQSNTTVHRTGPHRFTTDDLIDLRQVHPGDPDFNPTAPFITSAPTQPTLTTYTTTPTTYTPDSISTLHFPHQLRSTPTHLLPPYLTRSHLPHPPNPNFTLPAISTAAAHQVDIVSQYEPFMT
ncbi:hypothetical protein FRB93_005207 [Tulasnella sp. JGI-2019a]|nr:hypothetical protein FRB93_005207 [Tulasnella sp. JGI-2019a]